MAVCEYPQCAKTATKTWALVDLCDLHHKWIKEETDKYYNGKSSERIKEDERVAYRVIAHKIPWSKVNMGEL